MKNSKLLLLLIATFSLYACRDNTPSQTQAPSRLANLREVDDLLTQLADEPQRFSAPASRKSTLTGAQGTIIHLDPAKLETIEGSPMGSQIELELIEATNKSDLVLNNVQTVSDGKLLVSGGSYYLNLTSDGKQLRMKPGQGIEVEFPKLSPDKMAFFSGQKNRFGQMNWAAQSSYFEEKDLKKPQKPKKSQQKKKASSDTSSNIGAIVKFIEGYELTEEEKQAFEKARKAYVRSMKEYRKARKTYQTVEILTLGWQNCDRFYNDPRPKAKVKLLVQNDSLAGVRFYAVFKDEKMLLTEFYSQGQVETPSFKILPVGVAVGIFALSARLNKPYFFETSITTLVEQEVLIDFSPTTHKAIIDRFRQLN